MTTTSAATTSDTASKPITRSVFAMCILAAIFYCYEYYLRVAPSVMSEELKFAFSLNDAAFGQLAAFYYYAYTPMQIPVGIMMDKFGVKKILTFACLLCVIGTYFFATTEYLPVAQLGRFLVGFGSAFAYVGVLKISDVWLPKKYFAFMAGATSTLGMFGGISGEIVMSQSVTLIGWRETMYYALFIGIILCFALWFILKDDKKKSPEVNKLQEINTVNLEVNTINQEVNIINNVNKSEKTRFWAGFMYVLSKPSLWLNGLIGSITFLPITAFAEIWAIPYLQSVGFKESASYGSSMLFLGFAVGGPLFGLISDKFKSRKWPLMIGSLITAIILFFALRYASSDTLILTFGLLFLAGFFTSSEILIFAIANDLTPPEMTSIAVAFTNMMTMIGGILLPRWIGQILDSLGNDANKFSTALMVLPVAMIIASGLCLLLKESYSKQFEPNLNLN